MPRVSFVPPEGSRYGSSLVFVPGLWSGGEIWRRASTYFAHRGWEGRVVELLDVTGGSSARVLAVAECLRDLPAPPVLIGHDAGALVALGVCARIPVRALVLVSPLVPGAPATHALLWSWRLVWRVLTRHPVEPPSGRLADLVLGELPDGIRRTLAPDEARLVAEFLRTRSVAPPSVPPPTLLVRGAQDPLLALEEARALARSLEATLEETEGGHWPMIGPGWQQCVERVHRWLVRGLDESLLAFYADAVAEREESEDEP